MNYSILIGLFVLKNGSIRIFDTKQGQTATDQETADKAKALALKLSELGSKYTGGIAVFENGVWVYNNSEHYSYASKNQDIEC